MESWDHGHPAHASAGWKGEALYYSATNGRLQVGVAVKKRRMALVEDEISAVAVRAFVGSS